MASEEDPSYIRALEQLMTPIDRNLICQDADPQAVAQFLLNTYFSVHITEWSSAGLHLEDRYDSQEPVAIRLISSLSMHLIPSTLVKMTAISPNKIASIAILCNHSIILHSDMHIIIPPYKTRASISNINTERFYQKLLKMRPRNARLHGASFKCPYISLNENIVACSVSDYGDICIIHESGEVAILDHVEFIPGRQYTYLFTSPFSMLSHREESESQADPYVVAYDCCFPPDSNNYLQCDSTLIVVRAIGKHTELKLERCVYSCTACTIDDLALRGGVRRNWTIRQMPTITFQITFDSTIPLSLNCSISPYGEFAVITYSGLHFNIPILHVSNSVRHVRQPVWDWSPSHHLMSACQQNFTCGPHNCQGCTSTVPNLDSKSESLASVPGALQKATLIENHSSSEPVPIPCRCNCLQLMPLFDTHFNSLLNSYTQWLETDNGSYVMTHNLHAIIKNYMPHILCSYPSQSVRISWSQDGSIYCIAYAGLFIFSTIFGVLFRVELKDVTSAAVCSGPIISFAASTNSIIGKDISFEFLGGRFLAFRFSHALTIFQIVLPFNKIGIEYPERWDPSTHTIATCQLIREIPSVSSLRTHPETSINPTVSLRFIPQINAISFISYSLRNYNLVTQLLLSSSPLEAKELQEGLADELNPNQSSDSIRELGVATEIQLFFKILGEQVSMSTRKMFDLISTLADYQSTTDYGSHLAKIASGTYTAIEIQACEAVLVPLNILRRRYTKDLSPLSLIAAEQIYLAVTDSIVLAFGANIYSFFYKQLTNYQLLFSSQTSKSLDDSSESSDIFTGESDDATDTSQSDNSWNIFRYTKTIFFMAISLVKLTALFVRASYALSAARSSLLTQKQTHQLPYKNNELIGCTIPASTCLSLTCGYCCLAYDNCVYRALCCEERNSAHKEYMQRSALLLLCIHALARRIQFYFLDNIAIQMLSVLLPGSSGTSNKPQDIAVPLLPFYVINAHYPSIEPASIFKCSNLSLEKRFIGVSKAGSSCFIPEAVISLYNYLFEGTSIANIGVPNNPYNRLYLQSVINVLKEYKFFQYQNTNYNANSQQQLAIMKGSSILTHSQILSAAHVAGRTGRFLVVVSYLLKLSSDSNYCGPSSTSANTILHTAPAPVCLTELQCSVLTRLLTICDMVKNRSPLPHVDIDFLLSLRSRADIALLDSLVYFLLYVTEYNTLLDFNCFLTYQRNVYTEPRCHCGPSPTMQLSSFGIAGKIRYSFTFSDTAYIDNLPSVIRPLFTPLCIALFLLTIGRVEDGIFVLAKNRYYSAAIHLLRCFLTSFTVISNNTKETIDYPQNASAIDKSPINIEEKRRTINMYSCKISNLERLCSELETNQSVLARMYGPERDFIKEIDYSITLTKESDIPQSRISEPPSQSLSSQSKRSIPRSYSSLVELKHSSLKTECLPEIDDFHVNKCPEIGEVLSTSAVKEDHIVDDKAGAPEENINLSINEKNNSSISIDRPQYTGFPPPPLPPASIPLSRYPPQPPPLPPQPGSIVTQTSIPAQICGPTSAPVATLAPPVSIFPSHYSFQPRPISAGIQQPSYPRNNASNWMAPNLKYLPASNVSRSVHKSLPIHAPAYSFQPLPSRSASNHSPQRPLSVLTTSHLRPSSAYLPTASKQYICSLPIGIPTASAPENKLATPKLQLLNERPLNHSAVSIAQPFQMPKSFQQQIHQCKPSIEQFHPQQVVTPAQVPVQSQQQQQNQQVQKSIQLPVEFPSKQQGFISEPQKQKRMQPQIQSIEISSMDASSTLSINDPYPPQRSVRNHQMCSNLEMEEHTPALFSPSVLDSTVDLGTQDYRNMAQYLHVAAPKHLDAPTKRSRLHNDIRWMDISKNIEEIDQLTAAAQGTMDYLQALTREVEGNEQRLLRVKY